MRLSSLSICHVVQSLDRKTGGPPVIAWNLATAQHRRGHSVQMCAVDGVDSGAAESSVGEQGTVPVVPLPRPGKLESLVGRGPARAALADVIRGADVVHLHGVWDPILRVAALEARAQRRPYLILLNGMLDPWSLKQKWLKKRVALALGYRALLNQAARLHFGNRDEERLIEPLRLRAAGVIVPNGIDAALLQRRSAAGGFRKTLPVLENHPYVLFLSRLHVKKGLDRLAEAFSLVATQRPNVRLVVAGPDEGAKLPFERQIERLGLSHRVHVVGPLYGDDKWNALTDAACLCLPSHQEGFSIALLEALASRLPVVISEHCHFPEVAEHGAGLVVPLNPAALATALVRVLADNSLRQRMGAAGRQLVEARYTWDKVAEKCDQVYADVLSVSARVSPGFMLNPLRIAT